MFENGSPQPPQRTFTGLGSFAIHAEDDVDDIDEWDPSKSSFMTHCVSGSIAGLCEHSVMYPFDTWKTYLQARVGQRNVREVVQKEGISRLWRGLSTMFMGSVPAHALYFSSYEASKEFFGANGEHHNPVGSALSGAIATVSHDLIMTPMDVVKQRLQLGFHTGVTDAVRSILSTQGWYGLYRSFPVALSMNVPFAAINVASNESLKRFFNPSGEQKFHISLLCGGLAGGIAGALTTPLDVVRTRIQTQTLHPSQFKPAPPQQNSSNSGRKFNLSFSSYARQPVMVANATSLVPRSGTLYGSSRAKYTRPMRCPLPIALWATIPGTSTLAKKVDSSAAAAASSSLQQQQQQMSMNAVKELKSETPGVVAIVKSIWTKEGYLGFFRGATQRIFVQAPAVAISWGAYETTKDFLLKFEG